MRGEFGFRRAGAVLGVCIISSYLVDRGLDGMVLPPSNHMPQGEVDSQHTSGPRQLVNSDFHIHSLLLPSTRCLGDPTACHVFCEARQICPRRLSNPSSSALFPYHDMYGMEQPVWVQFVRLAPVTCRASLPAHITPRPCRAIAAGCSVFRITCALNFLSVTKMLLLMRITQPRDRSTLVERETWTHAEPKKGLGTPCHRFPNNRTRRG